jgi:hypothetical protein
MVRIRATITIEQQAIFAETVIVRAGRGCSDREWHLRQYLGFEDALRSNKRHSPAFKFETLFQQASREYFAVRFGLLRQPIKGG